MSADVAKITITSGPDRGKTFELRDDLVHIGHGPDNQVSLSDSQLASQQVSIVSKNGRYAIYTPVAESVDVDGATLPPERWVWLPASARVRIGTRNAFQFTSDESAVAASVSVPLEPPDADPLVESTRRNGGAATATRPATDAVPRTRPAPAGTEKPQDKEKDKEKEKEREKPKRTSRKAAKVDEAGRKVARFVTDQGGDALVKLGEDGNLPELALAEGAARRNAEKRDAQGGSLWVYVGLGVSVLLSTALALIDFEEAGWSAGDLRRARQEVTEFFGDERTPPQTYQVHLRTARIERSRGNRDGERREYRRVLDLLNSEDNNPLTGLTGSPERDDRLRRLIGTLMRQ